MSGPIFVTAGATLAAGTISLSGTSYDFGLLDAAALTIAGSAIIENASITGLVSVTPQGLADIAGTLWAVGATLAANAVVTGDGTFQAATIAGGTLIAFAGDTLLVSAGTITGANLDVAGGVLVLGQDSVASSVTLGFLGSTTAAPGAYPDSLASNGGMFVIEDPLAYSGTITGFAAGDRLLFPGLTGLTVSNVTATSFQIAGRNSASANVQFTINAAIPAGTTLVAGQDLAGDAQIGLRAGTIGLAVGGSGLNAGSINASLGIVQSILGLEVLLPSWTSQSLTPTLSAAGGKLSDGTLTPSSSLVITAPNPTALDAGLAGLAYTASIATTQDALTVSSHAGELAGLNATIPMTIKSAGTFSGLAGATDAQTALFAGPLTLVTQPAAVGQILVTGTAEFDDLLAVPGIAGTSLLIDAGGSAVFGAGSGVTLGSNVTVGDANGAGTLAIETADFAVGAATAITNLVIASSSLAAASAVEITGGVTVNGGLIVGVSAAARLDLSGDLAAETTTIGAAGTVIAAGNAAAALGALVDAGTLALGDDVQAEAANLILTGGLQLGGTAELTGLSSAVIGGAGRLTVGSGTTFNASQFNQIGGSILIAGALQVAGNLMSNSGITLGGGTLGAAAATLGSLGVISGFGEIVLGGAGAKLSAAGGDIIASNGMLVIDGNLAMSNGGSIAIAGGAAIDLADGASGSVVFEGAFSELIINDLAVESAAVSGMVGHDVIDLIGIAPSLVSYSGGVLSAQNAGGQQIGSFALSVAGSPAVQIVTDGSGGALVTLGDEMACFARGTRLLTPNGYVPVEAFKPGDPIITQAGVRKAVRWIGRRMVQAGLRARSDLRPVVVMPGALGPGSPAREVRLSPSHAVFLDGVLVPVMHLVNGATIRRERRIEVTYYHLELDRHEVLIAEGLPVESYRDTGNRGQFDHETGLRGRITKPCGPLLTGGQKLHQIRRRLHETALKAGFTLAHDPKLHGLLHDTRLQPEMLRQGNRTYARFLLPADSKRLLLIAQSAVPADTDPESDDRRELGICVAQPRGKRDRLHLGAGWYQKSAGDAGFWMGGSGELLIPSGVTELKLHLAAVAQSWQPPSHN